MLLPWLRALLMDSPWELLLQRQVSCTRSVRQYSVRARVDGSDTCWVYKAMLKFSIISYTMALSCLAAPAGDL